PYSLGVQLSGFTSEVRVFIILPALSEAAEKPSLRHPVLCGRFLQSHISGKRLIEKLSKPAPDFKQYGAFVVFSSSSEVC
ncbi:hypothetical protein, partial [Yersinia enterocolitica]|uniref:hypothetical protein n=1 Tax=Yersinia enterocolitica TaxID=630 RepID=UPI001E4E2ED0